ncbi:putative peptidoglycan D,D-transpeptidase PenA [Deinococcus xinjiangensis]|uniref:Peptidoglycan D,D-transpeptidase PenA n=1 Tax=Deinococcus xinjiangensis TaxID=457454 RepID=A0ABP9VF75_9DEIO
MQELDSVANRLRSRTRTVQWISATVFIGLMLVFIPLGGQLPASAAVSAVQTVPSRGKLYSQDNKLLATGPAQTRRYPQGRLAAQVLGFTGEAGGLEGLERTLEEPLSQGRDQILTLNSSIQEVAESALAQAGERVKAQYGSVVVLDRRSGAVLALANWPAFDLNRWQETSPVRWRNRAALDEFEPGSVVKALTVAALLNEGRTSREQVYSTPMRRSYAGTVINDLVPHPARLNTQHILRYSSNVGMTRLVESVPPDLLYSYFRAYGLGESLPLELPNVNGVLPEPRNWSALRQATMSFGQGLSLSALQLAAAFNVLANDGEFVSPSILSGTVAARRQVLRPETAREMQDILSEVVDEGIPTQAEVPGYHAAGKTGTAQVAVGGRYSSSVFTSTFAGFFPAASPQYTVVVMVYGAQTNFQGSQLAAPIFREIKAAIASMRALSPEQGKKTDLHGWHARMDSASVQ